MCYSAQVYADWKKFTRMFGARMSVEEFYKTIWTRNDELQGDDEDESDVQAKADARSAKPKSSIIIPKALELAFAHPVTERERDIKTLIDAHTAAEATAIEQKLFAQRTRLVEAERDIAEREAAGRKVTKQLINEVRVATNKMGQAKRWLTDLRRAEPEPTDSRIYPGWYCPVMVVENGELVVMPMRYRCRPHGKPAFYDTKFEGTYNARRDNLEGTCGATCLATATASSSPASSSSTSTATSTNSANCVRARKSKTWSSSSTPTVWTRCSSHACGRDGSRRASLTC